MTWPVSASKLTSTFITLENKLVGTMVRLCLISAASSSITASPSTWAVSLPIRISTVC